MVVHKYALLINNYKHNTARVASCWFIIYYRLVMHGNSDIKLMVVYFIINSTRMDVTRSLLEDIKTKQLQWYGHVQRMEEGRLPEEVLEWRPSGRRKRGRPKLTWAEGIRGMRGEKGLKEEDWADRNN